MVMFWPSLHTPCNKSLPPVSITRSFVLFHVTKLEHPVPVALRPSDSFLELLHHLRVRREVLASLAVDGREALAHQVHVDRPERVFGRYGIRGVDEPEV